MWCLRCTGCERCCEGGGNALREGRGGGGEGRFGCYTAGR